MSAARPLPERWIATAPLVPVLLQFLNMSGEPVEVVELPELHLEILQLVWSEWNRDQNNRFVTGGVTRDEIFVALREKPRRRWKPSKDLAVMPVAAPLLISKSATLKSHLKALCDDRFHRLVSKRTADYRGGPLVYMINDLTTATYSSTAYLLVHLYQNRHMETRDLIRSMLAQSDVPFLPGAHTQEETSVEIQQQIDWCLDRQYLAYVDKHPTELRYTERLRYEYHFLEFVARHPRLAGASRSPGTADSAASS